MHRLLNLAVSLLLAGTVAAQDMPDAEPVFLVQYTVEAVVQPEPEQAFAHPVIEAVARQEELGTLDVTSQGSQLLRVEATFRFGSMTDFQHWYAADETRALLLLLGEGAEQRGHLAVQRLR